MYAIENKKSKQTGSPTLYIDAKSKNHRNENFKKWKKSKRKCEKTLKNANRNSEIYFGREEKPNNRNEKVEKNMMWFSFP